MKVEVTTDVVKITEYSPVHEGDLGVNKCEFILPECFGTLNVTASFNGIPVPLSNAMCYIPLLKEGAVTLGVYAYSEEAGKLKLMYSPEPAVFYVTNGSYKEAEPVPEAELLQCESMLNTYKQQLSEEINSKMIIKRIKPSYDSILSLNTGLYWIEPGSYLMSGDDVFSFGFLMLDAEDTHIWFFVGAVNGEKNVWSGNTYISSNGVVKSILLPILEY